MPEPTVREQQTKCKDLRKHLVDYVDAKPGEWTRGYDVVKAVTAILANKGIFTTGEVLAKELRKAQRLGQITKRKSPSSIYVEYTANAPTGLLFDNSLNHHGE